MHIYISRVLERCDSHSDWRYPIVLKIQLKYRAANVHEYTWTAFLFGSRTHECSVHAFMQMQWVQYHAHSTHAMMQWCNIGSPSRWAPWPTARFTRAYLPLPFALIFTRSQLLPFEYICRVLVRASDPCIHYSCICASMCESSMFLCIFGCYGIPTRRTHAGEWIITQTMHSHKCTHKLKQKYNNKILEKNITKITVVLDTQSLTGHFDFNSMHTMNPIFRMLIGHNCTYSIVIKYLDMYYWCKRLRKPLTSALFIRVKIFIVYKSYTSICLHIHVYMCTQINVSEKYSRESINHL